MTPTIQQSLVMRNQRRSYVELLVGAMTKKSGRARYARVALAREPMRLSWRVVSVIVVERSVGKQSTCSTVSMRRFPGGKVIVVLVVVVYIPPLGPYGVRVSPGSARHLDPRGSVWEQDFGLYSPTWSY